MKRWNAGLCVGTLSAVASLGAWLTGCDTGAPEVNPAPSFVTDAGKDAAFPDVALDGAVDTDAAPDGATDAGPRIREVFHRDIFGNLDPTNMAHDGDFELSGLNSMQYPWLGIEQSYIRTGAVCRSGLRCIALPRRQFIAGMYVWPDAPFMKVTFYGQPTSENCSDGVGYVYAIYTDKMLRTVRSETSEPEDGWCKYEASVAVPTNPGYQRWVLFVTVEREATGPVVFDDVSMVGATEGSGTPFSSKSLKAGEMEWVREMGERVEQMLPPNPPREPAPVKNPTGRSKR